jgi:hypothetical protein
MLREIRSLLLVSLCFFSGLLAYPQDKQPVPDLSGKLVGQNTYENPALGLTITLPGSWRLLAEKSSDSHHDDPRCSGPLCGNPEIDVAMQTTPGSDPGYKVSLIGFKLSATYLNRHRYPLKWFAQMMLEGSMGSELAPTEKQTAIQLDGRPAFRLLMGRPGEKTAIVIGYVSEANGYVFLLVGATPTNPQALQLAIEASKFQSASQDSFPLCALAALSAVNLFFPPLPPYLFSLTKFFNISQKNLASVEISRNLTNAN